MPEFKKVYLVTSGDGTDGNEWLVEEISSTEQKAQAYIDEFKKDYEHWSIEEWAVD